MNSRKYPAVPSPAGLIPAPAPAPVFKALAAAGLLTPFVAHGATITVNTTAVESGSVCTLRDAARNINDPGTAYGVCTPATAGSANTIVFGPSAAGTITYANTEDYGGAVTFTPRNDLTITGPGATVLGITCNSANTYFESALTVYPMTGNVAANVSISGLTIRDCTVAGAAVIVGGYYVAAPVNATLSDMVIVRNVADGKSSRGGMFFDLLNTATVDRTTIADNIGFIAGGIGTNGVNSLTVKNSTISGNFSDYDYSAIASVDGYTSLDNVTVSGNTNKGGPGAVGVNAAYGFDILHSTIVNNTGGATHAGLVVIDYNDSKRSVRKAVVAQSKLDNSIVCGNGPQSDIWPNANVSANFNLLGVIYPNTYSVTGIGNVTGCTAGALSGWIGPLTNNGGPTATHKLLKVPGNPAINSGDPAFSGVPNDQRGVAPRISEGRTDMGAVEFVQALDGPIAPTVVPTTGAVGLGALSVALAALGLRRRRQQLQAEAAAQDGQQTEK